LAAPETREHFSNTQQLSSGLLAVCVSPASRWNAFTLQLTAALLIILHSIQQYFVANDIMAFNPPMVIGHRSTHVIFIAM
jgi:hypothetical protein